jgi:hypothetical protein
LGFDTDGDGKTTLAEFTAGMEKRFFEVDTDGNGIISRPEFDAYWQRLGRTPPPVEAVSTGFEDQLVETCAVPRPTKDASIVLFNAYSAEGLSSVAIGSQDQVTEASRVIIESGDQPLYLVLIAHRRMMWKFEGAVGRVQRVVLVAIAGSGAAPTPVGATGLPRNVITFGGSGNCMTFWVNMHGRYPDLVQRYSRLLFLREPNVVAQAENVWNLRLPSGQVSAPTRIEQQRTLPIDNPTAVELNRIREQMLLYSPGGLVPIDLAAVVAAQPAERYEVFPGNAGLLQLMLEGAIEQTRNGDFLVREKIRFPAGLPGPWFTFQVPKGVPVPSGDPGNIRVWSEEAGGYLCLSVHCKYRQK